MKILKRDGSEVEFNREKIVTAIQKANQSIDSKYRIKNSDIKEIAEKVELDLTKAITIASVEDIQDIVEDCLVKKNAYELAKSYIIYRYEHAQDREESTFDSKMLSIINQANEEVMQENANKNPKILSTQRDYSAGEVSKRIARKYVFDKELIELHDKGIIHIHDLDYRGFKSTNCCLVNLDDMLQNGTVISKTKIDKPHLFSTACNVTTQIMAQVASGQYGGSSYNMYHLAKFVDVSRQKFRKETIELLSESGLEYTDEQLNTIVESKVKNDIRRGIQTIQYQILTLMTTNG